MDDSIGFLRDQARLRRIVSYSELNSALARRGHVPFDFAVESDRNAVGAILSEAVHRTIGDTRLMLSAIVAYLDRNNAGPGFYKFATQLGLLPNTANADDKLAFWSAEVDAVHNHYARRPRRRW
ncbi:hypothetical protein ACRCUN_29300 [Mycobacterium sp. LTG2003]